MMMPNMMFGMTISMFFWLILGTLLFLLILGLSTWLILGWLRKQRTQQMQSMPQPRDAYEGYEQGYRADVPGRPIYQEGDQLYSYPQAEEQQKPNQAMEQLRR